MSEATVAAIADAVTTAPESASLKVALVTAVETSGSFRVQTDQTGDTWLSRDAGTTLTVGDRVWVIQQGGVWLVGGRLNGGTDTPIGSISLYAGATAPAGWLICDGTAVSRTTYNDLFTALGTTYGAGNGTTTFNLPNLANRFPIGTGTNARGATGGTTSQSVTLTTANLPSHDHGSVADHGHGSVGGHDHGSVGDHTHSVANSAGGTGVNDGTAKNVATLTAGNSSANGGHTHSSDGGHSHSNAGGHSHTSVGSGTAVSVPTTPPFLSLNYILKAL